MTTGSLSKIKIFKIIIIILILVLYLFLVKNTYKDYGSTWDEGDFMRMGQEYYNYVLGKPSPFFNKEFSSQSKEILLVLYNHSYPAISHAISVNIFKNVSLQNTHLINFLFFTLLLIFVVLLFEKQYKKLSSILLGLLFIFLMPRLIGNIPINSRDISFAIAYFISVTTLFLLVGKKSRLEQLVLGMLFGITISLRIIGISLFIIYFIYKLIHLIRESTNKRNLRREILSMIIELVTIVIFSLLIFVSTSPYIGANVLINFQHMLSFSKVILDNALVLFNGSIQGVKEIGPVYLFVWFIISTPSIILIFLMLSLFQFKKLFKNYVFVLFLITFIVNLVIYIVVKPIIFDSLRHYLFILPILSVLSVVSLIEIINNYKRLRIFVFIILIVGSISVLNDYIKLYPYQYIYFSEIVGGLSNAHKYYETDYWGSSFKEAFTWLVNNEIKPDKNYKLAYCANSEQFTYLLPKNVALTEELSNADYFICFSRQNINLNVDQKFLIHTISRDGVPLAFIYDLRNKN